MMNNIFIQDNFFEDDELLKNCVKSSDVIIHLAALNRHLDQNKIFETNIQYTGIDIVEKNIKTASAHSEANNLPIKYMVNTVEDLAEKKTKYDVILNMEVIEHVSDVSLFIRSCSDLLSENGIMIFASLNRTLISYGLAIIGVEYILGWLPKGTHDWNKFITPEELKVLFKSNELKIDEIKGVKYNPIFDTWKISDDLSVNYLGFSSKINS